MKYILHLTIASICFITSCDNNNQATNPTKIETKKIDPLLDKIFKKDFPNFKDNQIVRDNALSALNKAIDSVLPLSYLNDIPLKVFKVSKNPHGKGALVQFYTDDYSKNDTTSLANSVRFDIIGLMDETLAASINEKNTYFLYSHKYKRLNKTEAFLIVNQVYFSPTPKIDKGIGYGEEFEFHLGNFICEVDSLNTTTK